MDAHFKLLKEFEATKEVRLILKVASQFSAFRSSSKLTASLVESAVKRECSRLSPIFTLCKQIPFLAAIEGKEKASGSEDLVQVQCYVALLISAYCLDNGLCTPATISFTKACIQHFSCAVNARHLDSLMAKLLFLYSRMHEIAGSLQEIRPELLLLLKRASLNRDVESEACLINLLLRNYISSHLYDVADKLVSRITFPQQADASEIAKYLYYTGKIHAFKLNYSAACQNLFLGIRKCPSSAIGFLQASYKLAVLVQLLMGEIPERGTFRLQGLQQALFPYYRITQSVRNGDIALFQAVLQEFMETWKRDSTLSLVLRLRHNVIRAGVKKISIAYSRISLYDVQKKLLLDTVQDAEYIVMKCIKDGIVDAFIDHEAGFAQSRETLNAYATQEPGVIFNKRINFCLDSRAESIRAMRFHGSSAGAEQKTEGEDSEKGDSLEEYMDADELAF